MWRVEAPSRQKNDFKIYHTSVIFIYAFFSPQISFNMEIWKMSMNFVGTLFRAVGLLQDITVIYVSNVR
jgi:hypothetical protein